MNAVYCRRALRVVAASGMIAAVGAAWLAPSAAQAHGYYGRGRGYVFRHAGYGRFGYGGYGPGYAVGYYPGAYYAPQPYLAAPAIVYLQPPVAVVPRVSYMAPGFSVRRSVHPAPVHRVVAKPVCGCVTPPPVMPVALPAPAPAAPATPVPPPQNTFEPPPFYGD